MAKSKSTEVKVEAAGADKELVAKFEKALDRLYKGKWAQADKAFEEIAEADRGSSLAERCGVLQEVCRRNLEETSDEDLYLSAVMAKNRGDLDAAMDYCNRGGLKGRDERFAYLAATIEALRDNREEARKQLDKAIEMDPASRVHAFWDPDFEPLRDDPDFADLFTAD